MNNQVEIKSMDEETVVLGGYAAMFGDTDDRDLENEYFSKDTDFWIDKWTGERPVLYDHGHHPEVGKSVLGKAIAFIPDEKGLSIEAELSRHNEYIDVIIELVKEGALGWSSGAVNHLVEREDGHIKSWPIAEMTLTPTPAEPRLLGPDVLIKLYKSAGIEVPGALVSAGEEESGLTDAVIAALTTITKEVY